MRLKEIVFIVITGIAVCSASASITIIENSAQRLSFVFTMEDFALSYDKIGEGAYARISFTGSNCQLYSDGAVALPSRSCYVGVPQSGDIQVRFVSNAVKRMVLDHPLPPDSVGYHSAENVTPPFPNPWVSAVTYVTFRRMRTGHFFIRPFLYNPVTRQLTVLQKGTCTIDFPAAAKRGSVSPLLVGDYYTMLRDMVLNYARATQWLKPAKRIIKKRQIPAQLPANEKMLCFSIGDGHSGVNDATTYENGIMKISASDVTAFFDPPVSIATLGLFGSQRCELNDSIPTIAAIPDGVYEIPLMRVDQNGNGLFDGTDYLLAYVTGISDWHYDSTRNEYVFQFNRMENDRSYWLRKSGGSRTIVPFVCTGSPVQTVTLSEDQIRYKKSKQLMHDNEGKGGIEWIWTPLTGSSGAFSYILSLPYVNQLYPGAVRVNPGLSTTPIPLQVSFGDSVLSETTGWWPIANWQDSVLTIALAYPEQSSYYEIQSFDVRYWQSLDMQGRDMMRIYSPLEPESSIVQYQVSNLPAEKTFVFRLSPDEQAMHLVDTVTEGGTCQWVDTTGIGIQYIVCTESGLLPLPAITYHQPASPGIYEIGDLRNTANQADYLIITHNTFKSEALRLAEHKKSTGKFSFPRVVDIADVFREFSGGNFDPSAVRNFLYYATHFWTPVTAGADPGPDYVLLLGNGHYDYKNYDTQETNFIPTAQIKIYSAYKCIEDFFACVDSGYVTDNTIAPGLFLGRVTCETITEAQNVVDKIIDIEGPDADWGAWRNRVLLVSDDDMQGSGRDFIQHYQGNEDIGDYIKEQRPYTEIRKVILFEYEWNELYQKPEANAALFNEINNGVTYVNYFGHGNEHAWADEGILDNDKIGNFHNSKQYPVINSFSCSVAYFDKPDMTCMSGLMINTADAGAIAAVASARTAYATRNTSMSKEFFRILYERNTSWSLGQAYSMTKLTENLKHYVLLGDPSIKFMDITDSVALRVETEQGVPLDTIKALQKIVVKGTVLRNNVTNGAFGIPGDSAYVMIGLYNPDQDSVTRKDGGTWLNPIYRLAGTPAFVGTVKFIQGQFQQKILVPRNVTFKKPGVTLTAYAWHKGEQCGGGYRGDLIFSGSDTISITDNTGPCITVRPVYDNDSMWNTPVGFTDKISSFLPLECEISVWDENGVDVSSTGPDEGLSIEVDQVLPRTNINNKFIFDEGEYTRGCATVDFKNDDMKPGVYDMTVRAQDLLGTVSKVVVSLEILNEEDFKLGHVFNYPNPVRMGSTTAFYFYHANTSEAWHEQVEATLKIFTLSGKLIRVFPHVRNGQEWNLTDQRGRTLPPNVYLYRVTAKMSNIGVSGEDKSVKSSVKKLVIHPPR